MNNAHLSQLGYGSTCRPSTRYSAVLLWMWPSSRMVGAVLGLLVCWVWTSAQAQTSVVSLSLEWSSTETDQTVAVAWGDVDSDGDLDLAVGNSRQPNRLYRNDGGVLSSAAVWSSVESDDTTSVAWGDVDGDGDLDLAVGNKLQPIRLYRNDRGTLTVVSIWSSIEQDATARVAWGDIDGDGDLDLATGYRLYRNENGILAQTSSWSQTDSGSPAWGDVDSDGDLDLAVGPRLFRNDNGTLTSAPVWSPVAAGGETNWVDVDGDADLDLTVGTCIFHNEVGTLADAAICTVGNVGYIEDVEWGDIDNDGDPDLVIGINALASSGSVSILVYCNVDGNVATSPCSSVAVPDAIWGIALGDVDSDGDLDVAAANYFRPNRLYHNESVVFTTDTLWTHRSTNGTVEVAFGDADNDGDLDLAVANWTGGNQLFQNEGDMYGSNPIWLSGAAESVAWGDVDGDGDLDLAAGSSLYRNDQGLLSDLPIWSDLSIQAISVAWGDVDGDSDLDLAVGSFNGPIRVYRNENGGLSSLAFWQILGVGSIQQIAWGDFDNDGDLDLGVANWYEPNRIYCNRGGVLEDIACWSASQPESTSSLAWGDVDGDGYLDLVVGNAYSPIRLYHNTAGVMQSDAIWSSVESDNTMSIALGDADGDGDLDLATVGYQRPVRMYRNDNGTFTNRAVWSSEQNSLITFHPESVAWGDVDGDGDLDLAVGRLGTLGMTETTTIYRNMRSDTTYATQAPILRVIGTLSSASADFISSARIWSDTTVPIDYNLFHPKGDPIYKVQGFYSLNGGGNWMPAVATSDTITMNLGSAPYPLVTVNSHIYKWDVFSSGIMGQSDNVVFRLTAIPSFEPTSNDVAGPYQYGSYMASTFPFRLRGTQVRVVDENSQPAPNALVYRLPVGTSSGGQWMGSNSAAFRTNLQGYLSGRGELRTGDQLVALAPIDVTEKYIFYYTNGLPTDSDLDAHTVSQSGVQTLTVSAENPLLLFNLDVSLEWDATNDSSFRAQLEQDLAKTSAALYDWSNGQVALGKVTVYQARDHWDEADVHIFASNQVRPVANRGGIVTETTVLNSPDLTEPITATRGEIRIGPVWNRYGDAGPIGDDWPRVLAHELGHYALFLEDTYLGLDAGTGLLEPVESCSRTAMSDPYDDINSEFRFRDPLWDAECGATLAELPDWNLITLAYPDLHAPPPENTGPGIMPFAFTEVTVMDAPATTRSLLVDDNIPLGDHDDELAGGRAYLVQPGRQIVDLGRPTLSSVKARGAYAGDQLCVFATAHSACGVLQNGTPAQLTLHPLWTPEIILTPINTTTLRIQVNDSGGGPLTAVIYPNGTAPQTVTLTSGVPQLVALNQPAVEAVVDIRGNTAQKRTITSYAAGSGPGRARSHDGPGRARSHDGPFTSGDGRVVLYPSLTLPSNVFMVLQTATTLPTPPPGRVPIGRSYQIRASAGGVDFAGASATFQYIGMEVLLSELAEQNLAVYYWDGTSWQRLHTILNLTQNFASAPLLGPGLYSLMSSHQVSLSGPGWNLLSYPLQEPQAVTQALASMDGYYTTVYGYETTDVADPWEVYAFGVPNWVNDLTELRPGQGYWIRASQAVTWFVADVPVAASADNTELQNPPATYYGLVQSSNEFTPTDGLAITAHIDENLCGQATTQIIDGQVVYTIDVFAEGSSNAIGCGAPGRTVRFQVEGKTSATFILWDNAEVRELPLAFAVGEHRLYLPKLFTREAEIGPTSLRPQYMPLVER